MNIFDINVRRQSDGACQEIVCHKYKRYEVRRRRNVLKRSLKLARSSGFSCLKIARAMLQTLWVHHPTVYSIGRPAEVANEPWTSGNVTISGTKVQACNYVVANHCAVEQNRQVLVHRPPELSAELRDLNTSAVPCLGCSSYHEGHGRLTVRKRVSDSMQHA
jgi:hypothetical protein